MEPVEQEIPQPSKAKKSILKRIKKWVISMLIIIILLLTTFGILGYIYESDIKKYAVEAINNELKSDIILNEKDISFSFISSFPRASLNFKNVTLLSSFPSDTLLQAKKISLVFSIMNVFSGSYYIDRIDISNSKANVIFDKKGIPNYMIWEETTDTVKSSPFEFAVDKLNLKSITVNYTDNQSGIHALTDIKKGSIKGVITDKSTSITLNSRQFIKHIKTDSNTLFNDKESSLNLNLSYINETEGIEIKEGSLAIEKMLVDLTGNYSITSGAYSFITKTSNVQLSEVFSVLPAEVSKELKKYKSDALITSEATISKSVNQDNMNVKATFNVSNGTLTERSTGAQITNLILNGDYKLTRNTQLLNITKLQGDLAGGNFSGTGKMIGKNNLSIFSNIKMTANLKQLADFLNLERIENMEGMLNFNINQIKGTFKKNQFNLTQFSGKTDLQDVNLKLVGKKYSLANLSGDFNFNQFTSSGTFSGIYGSSDFKLNCQVQQLVEHIIDDKPLIISAYLQSKSLYVDELLTLGEETEEETDTTFHLPENISSTITTNIGELYVGKHQLSQLKGKLLVSPWQVNATDWSFKANDGIYSLNANLKPKGEDKYKLAANVVCGHINVTDFFERFDNFDQDVIESRHLKGSADAIINLSTELTSGLTVITPSLDVKTDFTISKGELIGLELFQEMADYIASYKQVAKQFVKVDQLSKKLKHIYFNELQNTVTIKNEKISLPNMFISLLGNGYWNVWRTRLLTIVYNMA